MLKSLFSFGKKDGAPPTVPTTGPSQTRPAQVVAAHVSSQLSLSAKHDGKGHLLLEVYPPEQGVAPHLDICLVIDTSGSMCSAANPNGSEDVKLFSKMDLAKRGAEVVARALGPNDTLTIIGFQCDVRKVMARTAMNQEGHARALAALASLYALGGTALWDGLHAGLHELEIEAASDPKYDLNRVSCCIILTDGLPQPSPPAGEVAELQKYITAREAARAAGEKRAACKLITIGLGYDLNSKLLMDLATTHGGGNGNDFAFIPDGTMLLTTFVNIMANLQSTVAKKAVLRLQPAAGSGSSPSNIPAQATVLGESICKPLAVHGNTTEGPMGLEILLGDVLYGQPRQVVLRLAGADGSSPLPSWNTWTSELLFQPTTGAPSPLLMTRASLITATVDAALVTQQLFRAHAITSIMGTARVAGVDLSGAQAKVKEAVLATMAVAESAVLAGKQPHPILEDLLGQVSEAVGGADAYARWGQHYLRALTCAHRNQACANFKDPGLLAYGGAYTLSRRDTLNVMCDSLPVPVPSIRNYDQAVGVPCAVSAATFRDAFNNRHGGCFGPEGLVYMADGSTKRVSKLRKGDKVWLAPSSSSSSFSPASSPAAAKSAGAIPAAAAVNYAEVLCVVTYSGVQTVRLPGSGLSITPWHPVRSNGQWCFPADIAAEAAAVHYAAANASSNFSPSFHAAAGDRNLSSLQSPAAYARSLLEMPAAVYNLVLDKGHVISVNSVECVTLGHGLTGEVVEHPFFGTHAVVSELQSLPGWQHGWVDLGDISGPVGSGLGMGGVVAAVPKAVPAAQLDVQTGLVCSLLAG